MTAAHDDAGFDDWPAEAVGDRLSLATGEMFKIIFEVFPDTTSAEHRAAMCAVLDLHQRLRAGRHRRTLN